MKSTLFASLAAFGFAIAATFVPSSSALRADSRVPADYLNTIAGSFAASTRTDAAQGYQNFTQGPFSASVHGIFREIARFSSIQVPYEDVLLPTSLLRSGEIQVQMHVSRDESGQVRRAPLAIVLNPLFGEKYFFQMTRFIQFFGERGFHVVVFQNTFGDSVTQQGPEFFPGNLPAESQMHRQAIQAAVGRIGAENVSGATLVGLSYGAFLASVLKADDAASAQPLINGPTLLLNPSYDILNSLRNLDRFGREANEHADTLCLLSPSFAGLLANGFFVDDSQRARINESCAKAFLSVFGFKGRLHHAVTELNRSKDLSLGFFHIETMDFESYMSGLAHIELTPGVTELGHWMGLAHQHGYDSFLVVGSTDDPINERFDFARSASGPIGAAHFLEVPTGGHTGIRSAASLDPRCKQDGWLGCLLKKIYPDVSFQPRVAATLMAPASIPAEGNACTDAQDAAIAKPTMEQQETSCARKCLGGNDCTAKCMVQALGITPACGGCWGDVAECGKKHCAIQCGLSPNGASCRNCSASHGCDAAFTACAGI